MRVKALNIIHDRLRGPNAGTKQQQQELMNKIRLSPKSLVAALNTKNTKVLHKAIIVIFTVTNGTCTEWMEELRMRIIDS